MSVIPIVTQTSAGYDKSFDIYSRLFRDRMIFLTDHINRENASAIVAQMLFLEYQDPRSDIYFYINTPGGDVNSGLAIYDAMQYIKPDVCTVCFGLAASMGAVLLSSGAKGKRMMFPHASAMMHQVKSMMPYSQASDIMIQAEQTEKLNHELLSILAENCNKPIEQIYKNADRDNFFNPKEALEYGLIDHII